MGRQSVGVGARGSTTGPGTVEQCGLHRALTPAVAAWLYGQLAVGAGGMGEELAARRAQDRSFELLARSTPADEPPWIYWYTESTAQHGAGRAPGSYFRARRVMRGEPDIGTLPVWRAHRQALRAALL
jgi:hypothetical protein